MDLTSHLPLTTPPLLATNVTWDEGLCLLCSLGFFTSEVGYWGILHLSAQGLVQPQNSASGVVWGSGRNLRGHVGSGASELGSESLSSLSGLGSLEGLSALRPVLARAPPPGSASPLSHLATMAVRPLMFSADTVAVGMRVYGSAWSTHRLLGSAPSTASRWRRQQPCDGGGNHSSERGLR